MQPFDDLAQIDKLLTTTKSVRRRLDLERPVARDVVTDCIRLAAYAPNASNAQEWRWVVVDDPDVRARAGEQYRKVLVPLVSTMLRNKEAAGDEAGARISRSILYLADRMGEVPVLVFPCYDLEAAARRYGAVLSPERAPTAMRSDQYASIYPAVWSFQLALRSRGLGSVLTTAHQEDQAAMAEILDIPISWDQTCLIPVAHVTGEDFTPSPRGPVADTIVWR
ncbi:MAG: nitroreductase [Acidimicrobiales bacterium]|nr:nitroreductase [Acidimicrobiales bacterium]